MKTIVFREASPTRLSDRLNDWFEANNVLVRTVCYAVVAGEGREALVLYDDVPPPTNAAERWIGEQLDTRKSA